MQKFSRPLAILLGLLVVAPSWARADMRPVFMSFMSLVCLHQNPTYQKGPFGKAVESSPEFTGWEKVQSTPLAKCLAERQWISEEICSSVNAMDMFDKKQRDAWFSSHMTEAQKLAPVWEFMVSPAASSGTCPTLELEK